LCFIVHGWFEDGVSELHDATRREQADERPPLKRQELKAAIREPTNHAGIIEEYSSKVGGREEKGKGLGLG
jgi:hypothetical protein